MAIDEINEEPKQVKKTARKYKADDIISCRSVTYGELLYPAQKSQLLYTWSNYGDTTGVEFQDLRSLRLTHSQYLYNPLFVIEDEELLEQWTDLKEIYNNLEGIDTNTLFSLPLKQFESRLKKIPASYAEPLKNIASSKVLDGSLDSIQKIRVFDRIFGTELMLLVQ